MFEPEMRVDREGLINALKNHVTWLEASMNGIVRECEGKVQVEVADSLAAFAQAKSTALLALSNLV